jgi:hypothetical protein
MESLTLDTDRHTEDWLRKGQLKLKEAAQHLLTARDDAEIKAAMDRGDGKKAEQGAGHTKRAK